MSSLLAKLYVDAGLQPPEEEKKAPVSKAPAPQAGGSVLPGVYGGIGRTVLGPAGELAGRALGGLAAQSQQAQRQAQIRETGRDFAPRPTAGERLSDAGQQLLSGFNSLIVQGAGGLYGIATQDFENPVTKQGRANEESINANLSAATAERKLRADEWIAQRSAKTGNPVVDITSEMVNTIAAYGGDDVLVQDLLIRQLPQLLTGVVGKGAAVAKGASLASKGLSAAEIAAKASKTGERVTVGLASALQGSDVATSTYDRLAGMGPDVWEQDPKYQKMVASGLDPETAIEKRSGEIAQKVGIASAALSGVLNKYMPTAEKAIAGSKVGKTKAGRIVGTAAGEMASEGLEEGGGQFIQNVGVKSADPTASLSEGVGTAAGLGALAGGPLGAGAGALSSENEFQSGTPNVVTGRLREAIDVARGTQPPVSGETALLSPPEAFTGTFSVGGLQMTADQVLSFAEANKDNNPRIAQIMSADMTQGAPVLEALVKELNTDEARSAERDVVAAMSNIVDGKTAKSVVMSTLNSAMSSIPQEVVTASPLLSQLSSMTDGKSTPKQIGQVISQFQPRTEGTVFARPERGGDGSVLMTQDQKSEEAKREREAEQSFRLAEARQKRYDQATTANAMGGNQQREDLRPGASEPVAQFVLADNHPTNPGAPATIVESPRDGYARVQYETGEVMNGMPVYASEEVPISGLRSRVVRGTARTTQDVASRQRKLRSGVGTQMEGPRNSIDRASTKQVSVVPEPGTAVEPYITESERIYNSAPEPTPEQVGGGVKRVETGTKAIEAKEPAPKGQERVAAPSRKAVGRDKRTGIEYQPGTGDNISVSREGEATIRDAKTSPPGEIERKGQRVIRMGDQTSKEEVAPKESEPTAEPTKQINLAKASARLGKMAGLGKTKPVKKGKKTDEGQFSRREGQTGTFETAPTIMSEEEAKAEIDRALEGLRGRGALGRVVANRISSVLKDKSYTTDQVFAAFLAGEEVTRVLKGRGDIDVAFVPSLQDGAGVEAQGNFVSLPVGPSGFRGIITLSLAQRQIPVVTQTTAHEAFHALQKILRKADPKTFAALNRSFRDGMTAMDVHPSVRRALQRTVNRATGNTFWDEFTTEFKDRQFSGYGTGADTLTELQAYVFGYLHDAQRYGMETKGLAVQFAKALDFFNSIFEAIGNALRGNGFTSASQIFADATSGDLSNRLSDAELDGGDTQFSRRKDFERPKISDTKIKVPIPETSSLNILYDDGSPSPKLPTEKMNGGQAAKWIQDRAQRGLRRVFGVDKITGPSPETDRYLSRTIAAEAMAAILKELKTGLRSALDWYTTAVENAITTAAEIYPILGSDAEAARLSNSHGIRSKKDARVIFTLGMSITSQNMAVRDNTRAAVEQMDFFMENVRFDPSKRYGTKAPSIASNLNLANVMLHDVFDGNVSRLGEFLDKEFTVGELNAYGRQLQEELGLEKPPFTVGGELVDQIVYGSAIFGPKIGNGFYQNLNGNFSPITIDLWFMRLWGRLTGTLLGNDAALTQQAQNLRDAVMADDHPTYKVPDGYAQQIEDATDEELVDIAASLFKEWDRTYKSLRKSGVSNEEITSQKMKPRWAFAAARLDAQKKANDAPTGGSQRKWIRSVIQGALTILKKNGYDLTAADLQAIIWYPEKDLHSLITKGRLEETLNVSYDTAISEIASQRKSNAPNPDDYAGRRNDDQLRGAGSGQADSGGQAEGAGREDAGQEAQYSRRATGPDVAGTQAGGLSGRGVVSGGEGLLQAQGRPGLQGLPRRVKIPATGQVITAGPYEAARNAADEYMRRAGLPYAPPQTYIKVDEDRARRIASAFEEMKDDPFDPEVRASYDAMLKETLEQWRVIKDVVGLSVDFIDVTKGDPYAPSPRLAVEDIVNNNHMWVFSTDSGYGQRGITPEDEVRNPLLARTGEIISGIDARANDIFRIVHDFFGHAKEGVGFRADGEENAWRQHVSMYSPAARNAVTVETRGQNSWLNYGPHGDANRNASTEDTIFADQKVGKLPQWVVDEGATDEGVTPQYSRRDPRANPAFNEWFGDSKVVNESGEPKLVYTGTSKDTIFKKFNVPGNGTWFTTEPERASEYALQNDSMELKRDTSSRDPWAMKQVNSTSRVIPAYLRIENPYVVSGLDEIRKFNDGLGDNYRRGQKVFFDRLRAQGHDGVQLEHNGESVWVVLNDPTQIKSPFNQTFNPRDPQFSRRNLEDAYALRSAPNFARTPMNFDGAVDEVGKLDDVIRKLQDRNIDTKRVQSQIEKAGRSISDEQNVYQTEELYHGKATKRSKDFVLRELNPLLKEMGQKGITTEALDNYLHARHAKERNAQIAKINGGLDGPGSGMTDSEADSYMAGLAPMRKRQLEGLASKVDEMIRETQRMLVSDGLENQTTIDNWNRTYQFYVPLQREGFEDDPQSAGQGMSVRGSSTRRAMGSTLAVTNILSNVAQARERAISRGERNRIGNALMGLALANPNESFWMVVDPSSKATQRAIDKLVDWGFSPEDAQNIFGPPQKRYIDSKGEVIHRNDRLFANADNVMATRINGEDRFIIFNPRNPRAKSMVESLKGLNTAQMREILGAVGKVTRYIASINTQYNPIFGMLNLIRDLQGAALNLSTTPIAGKQADVLADAWPAMMGIYSELRAGRRGEGPSGYWANLADEFESQGGKTGYRELFATPADRAKSIEKELNKDVRNVPMKVAGATFEWLSDFNETIENGVRLSSYKHALDAGLSKAQAASLAKNLTVNFNRKGTVGAQAGALYAFFNASVQGTARLAETLTGPAGRRIVVGGLLLGAAQSMMMAMAGIGDDVPDWVKDRNVIIPIGGKKYFTFPLPLGFHAIPATSRRIIDAFTNDDSAAMDVANLLTMYAEAFNPIGQSSIAQTISPTVFDWGIALAENRDFAGRRIYKENINSLDPAPGPERNKEGVSPLGAMVAIAIDRMTGGTGYTKGVWSPTGDQVDYVVGFFTGGVGREALKVLSTGRAVVTGEELPIYKVPLFGRFFGNANESFSIFSRYYDNISLMNRHEREVDGRTEDGKDPTDYLSKNPEAYLYEEAGNVERQVKALRKQAEQEEDATQKRYLNEEATMLMQEFNQRVADAKRTG